MISNTLKTIFGFMRSFIERRIPIARNSTSINDIYNYLSIDGLFETSGQPNEEQFALIRQAGYETVINLAPTSTIENSVGNEYEILSALGMEYIHIPVDFKNPTEDDFSVFIESLKKNTGHKVWVHCAANMRVSAFTYRYRRSILKENNDSVKADLYKIWKPVGVWKDFIIK